MLTRLLSAFIILFWLATTGWLVRTVWFGAESRFQPVAPEEALGAFFRWNETSTLTVLENGERIGQMVVSGYEGWDPRSSQLARGLSTQGNLDDRTEGYPGNEALMGTSWRMTADFDEETRMKAFQLSLRVPRQDLRVRLELAGEPTALGAQVMVGGAVLYQSGPLSGDGASPGGDRAAAPPSGGMVPPAALSALIPGGQGLADASAWEPVIEASRGSLEIAGSNQPVYLVKISFGSGESGNPIRLYFSEAGEPWRIDTGWGYEAVAEVLIPVERQLP